jgi:hypothetical protein
MQRWHWHSLIWFGAIFPLSTNRGAFMRIFELLLLLILLYNLTIPFFFNFHFPAKFKKIFCQIENKFSLTKKKSPNNIKK